MQVTFSNLLDDNGYLIDYGFDNELSGDNLRGQFIYTFNTATQPVVVTATPTSDLGHVDVTEPIVITFSKAMQTYDEATTKDLLTITEAVPGTALYTFVDSDYSTAWDSTKTVLTLTPKERAGVYGDVFRYSATYTVSISADFVDADGNKLDQRADLANETTKTSFNFKTKSSEAPGFTNLVVSRDRLNVVASFTAIVVDGAPIDITANKVGVISYKQADKPTVATKPADDAVVDYHLATIKENGSVESSMALEANIVYWLVPYVETTYNNDSSDTFFAGEPVKVVVHPWNLEDNQLGLASDTAALNASAENNPFFIETTADLSALADTGVTAYWTSPNLKYLQIANVTADNTSISDVDNQFAAQYNGGGFTIDAGTVSMFGYLNGGTVENVSLTNVNITSGDTVGGIVANMTDGVVKNNKVAGTINGVIAAGIAGSVAAGDISGNTNDAVVTATTTGGCITTGDGTLTDNVCLIHDHKAQVKADGSITENTDQTYLVGSIIVNPVIELASTTIPVNSNWTDLKDIGSSTQLVFTFSKPMDYKATEDAFTLNDGANDIPVSFAWSTKSDDSASVLTVIPVSPLSAETIYTGIC